MKKKEIKKTQKAGEKTVVPDPGNNGNNHQIPREQIEIRAYQIYVSRGCTSGREIEDWVQAEKELAETEVFYG